MAGSYVLPQVRVFQEFAETPNDVTQNLNPFVIGPNYQLFRYSDADERAECTTGDYVGSASLELAWAAGYDGTIVDTSAGYGVTLENAYVSLGDTLTPSACLDDEGSTGYGTKFEFTLSDGKSLADTTSDKLQFGVAVKAGDYLHYTTGSGDSVVNHYTKILSVTCGKLDPSAQEITTSLKDKATGKASTDFTANASAYTGEKAVTVNIKVTMGATGSTPKISWTSSMTGISGAEQELTATAINLGKGLTVTLKSSKTYTANTTTNYVLSVTLHEPYARDTVQVADLVPYTASTPAFRFLRLVDTIEVGSDYLVVDDSKVTVLNGVTTTIGSSTKEVFSATAYLEQRNFLTDHADAIYTVGSDADITTNGLGAITPENPLAYALHIMLLNCSETNIRYIAVSANTLEAYAAALDRASATTDVYAFCPLSEDREIIDAVVAHCKDMSTAEEKAWRIAFVSTPTDRVIDITPAVYDVPGKCKVTKYASETTNRLLTCYDATGGDIEAKFTETVSVGDTVKVITQSGEEKTTTVATISSNTTLLLKDAIADASDALCVFTILHTRSTAEYATAIAATSTSFHHRRAYNVFPNTLKADSGDYVEGYYAAAAVCGLACNVAPQQPITNVEINGFTDIPDTYSTFSRDQLNEIAGGGTLIVMQDKIGGEVYVRHQISTAYVDGNLNTTELSLTKNLDSISFYFANLFAPYIGRYNLTDGLLEQLRVELSAGLTHLESETTTNTLVGPQIIADGTSINSMYISTTEKDKAYADVSLNLPAPFNNFDLHLQVI